MSQTKVILGGLMLCVSACTTNPQTDTTDSAPAGNTAEAIVRYNTIVHPSVANAGMVVSQNEIATRIGTDVLRAGGNAVDAAVAVGFALAVTLPRAGNLGGSGFMLIHTAEGETSALDFRSAAPLAYSPEEYARADGSVDTQQLKFGPHAAGVPGTVAGLTTAWSRFGSLEWSQLLQPAIDLAAKGISVRHDLSVALASERAVFLNYSASRAVYLREDASSFAEGDIWRQPDLARTLSILAKEGGQSFYQGSVAQELVSAVQADGGYLSLQDLNNYRVRDREPLSTTYRDKQIVAMPPVSGGGITLLQMLNILGNYNLAEFPQGSAKSLHLLAETMKRGAANRRHGIGDPDFVEVPVDDALSRSTANVLAEDISLTRATPVDAIHPRYAPKDQSRDTTHYSVVDRWGNAVATTYTLGYSFGSGYVAGKTGILLDNQLRNFTYATKAHANSHAPGKRMMSTMTPTMVFNSDGELELVTGTPGGGRIINVLLQLLVNVIDYNMNLAAATHAPRIHQAWRSPELTIEPGHSNDTIELLRSMGHEVVVKPSMGSTQSIALENGLYFGAADPRRPGALAAGVIKPENPLGPE